MLEEPEYNLNPKFIPGNGKNKITNSYDAMLLSNYYRIQLKKQFKTINQYSIDFEPQLPSDATKISDRLIGSVTKQLKNKIGFICFKGRMIWGSKKSELSLIVKTEIEVKGQKQSYQLLIKPSTTITVEDFITKDQANLARLSQVINVNTKNVLKNIGFKQLDKGKFYNDNDFGSDEIKQAGLSVWRGYQVNLTTIGEKLFLKADPCSRVLRIQSFLETLKRTGKMNDKAFINQSFSGSSVITRYGNHRICRIEQIVYDMTPKSFFTNNKSQQKTTFTQYYKQIYQTTIKEQNQPLIKIIVKNCEIQEVHYLVPELVCLTGLTQDQRADFNVMKAVAQKTKLRADERIKDTNTIVRMLNKDGAKELMYQIEEKAQQFPGNVIGAPILIIGDNKQIQPDKGVFNLRDKIKDPISLKEYYFVYTSRGDRDNDDADATVEMLQNAGKAYGIKLDKPIYIDIQVKKGQRLSAKDWIEEIQKQNKNGVPSFVILYFNNDQKKDKNLYEKLKSHLIHKLNLNSQVITKKTLCVGAKGGMSKASKILLQINDKLGHPLYVVQKQHQFWNKNTIAIGSLAVSKGVKGYIASLVGTRSNDLTQHCSDYHRIEKKQSLPDAILSSFIQGWLKQYFKTQNKKLPGNIILYREGLNQKQAGKVLQEELKTIWKTFDDVSSKAKIPNWKPNLVYLLVNQKTGTRIYDIDRNGRFSNPIPGTIVGSQLSKDNSYEFLMASAATTEGTCNMVQYKVAYDSSNQQIPHQALKIITYEQCYNYPNWAGSIRFPATLQKANKLAKFVANHGQEKIDKANPLKGLDYYI